MQTEISDLSQRIKITGRGSEEKTTYWQPFKSRVKVPYPIIQKGKIGYLSFHDIETETSERILSLGGYNPEVVSLIMLSFYALYLYRFTRAKSFVLAFGQEQESGYISIAVDIDAKLTLKGLLLEMRDRYEEAIQYQIFPLDVMLAKLGMDSEFELFEGYFGLSDNEISRLQGSDTPFIFNVVRNENLLRISLGHSWNCNFNPGKLLESFSQLIYEASSNIDLPISSFGFLNIEDFRSEEKEKTIDESLSLNNKTATDIQEVWGSILGKELELDHNFFNKGGDSIKVIQACSRLTKRGYIISIQDIFKFPTITELSGKIKKGQKEEIDIPVRGEVPLIPIQSRFLNLGLSEPWHYNQAMIICLKKPVYPENLKIIFSKLLRHHDALRISFNLNGSNWKQENHLWPVPIEIHVYDYSHSHEFVSLIENSSDISQRQLQLETTPLLRLDYFITKDQPYLGITIHHLVMDAVSWGILLEDFDALLEGMDLKVQLPTKTASWKSWCEFVAGEKANSMVPIISQGVTLKKDLENSENFGTCTQNISFSLDEEFTKKLDLDVHATFRTNVQEFLLSALSDAVFELWNINRISIDVETHGRNRNNDLDVSRTIGWFTCIYPVHLGRQIKDDQELKIAETKEAVRTAQNFALDYMNYFWESTGPNGTSILFNYLGSITNHSYNCIEVSGIFPGVTQSPLNSRNYELELNSLITAGKLHVSITYNNKQYFTETIERLSGLMKEKLEKSIIYFSKQDINLLTPSDLIDSSFPLDELLELQTQLQLDDIYPLTPLQEGMLYHSLLDKNSGYYNTLLGYSISGELDISVLKQTFQLLIGRHSGLRSNFIQDKSGRAWQLILRNQNKKFHFEDLTKYSDREIDQHLQQTKNRISEEGFDLSSELLMRIYIYKIGERKYYFLWNYHHIIMDGWCMSILISEWMSLYHCSINGLECNLPPAKLFREYISWLQKLDIEKAYKYWAKYLTEYTQTDTIPRKRTLLREADSSARMDKVLELNENHSAQILDVASKLNVTFYVVIQALWGLILGKYGQSKDVVFGSVVSGRPSELDGVETMVGLFINNIPVRIQWQEDQMISKLLSQLKEDNLNSEKYQYCSLAKIQSNMPPGSPTLVNHIILYENYPLAENLKESIISGELNDSFVVDGVEVLDINNYPFTLVIVPGLRIRFRINFNPEIYNVETIDDMLIYLKALLLRLTVVGDQQIKKLGEYPDNLKQKLLEGGATPGKGTQVSTFNQIFSDVVRKYGGKCAIRSFDFQLTYTELENMSNRVANILRDIYGVKERDVVAIHLERSAFAYIAILGILKAGASYVPIDPDWPTDRKIFICRDADVRVGISLYEYQSSIFELGIKLLAIDIQIKDQSVSECNPSIDIQNADLAYIIYTSGSTGNPKGVKVLRSGNINMATSQIDLYNISSEDNVLQFAPLFFDASVYEWSIAFYSGACLCIPEPGIVKNPMRFVSFLRDYQISMATLPPAYFNLLELKDGYWPRILVQAGSSPDMGKTVAASKQTNCYNAYGPTECSVCISVHKVNDSDENLGLIPIGIPVPGNSIYILNEDLELMPMGAEGEICVSGLNVSQGYVRNPDLLPNAFLKNPYSNGKDLYRTGDLGRWHPGFVLEYRGRKDRQIKVRGYRIEPGEVENAIRRWNSITEVAVVLDRDSSGVELLLAYVVPNGLWNLKKEKQQLQEHLPSYMIPDQFVEVENIPLTENGKIDFKSLSYISGITELRSNPTNEIEKRIFEIWERVLEKNDFGIFDRYFEVGGNSLSLIRVHTMITKLYPKISIADIFNHGTIAEMALYISTLNENSKIDLPIGIKLKDKDLLQSYSWHHFSPEICKYRSERWETIANQLKINNSKIRDEEIILMLFSYALYEVFDNPEIRIVILNGEINHFRNCLVVDFDTVNTREDLMSHINTEMNSTDQKVTPLEKLEFLSGSDEVSVAFSFASEFKPNLPVLHGIDLILQVQFARNGDLLTSLSPISGKINSYLVSEIQNRLLNIINNFSNFN